MLAGVSEGGRSYRPALAKRLLSVCRLRGRASKLPAQHLAGTLVRTAARS